jgi:hypothetical protein
MPGIDRQANYIWFFRSLPLLKFQGHFVAYKVQKIAGSVAGLAAASQISCAKKPIIFNPRPLQH